MVLKNGDFIEDKFGQSQRNLLVFSGYDPEILQEVFTTTQIYNNISELNDAI